MNNIIVYSHFFTVQNAEIEFRKILYSVASDYTVFGMVWDDVKRKKVWRPVKTFGFYTNVTDEFRFHIGQLGRVIEACKIAGVYPDVYHVPLYEPMKEEFQVKSKYVLRDDQEDASAFIVNGEGEGSHSPLLSMPMGSGKGSRLNSFLWTPGGKVLMKDIRLGDFVCTRDGGSAPVLGIFPQGLQDVYEFIFSDGRKTTVDVNHLWKVYIEDDSEGQICSTAEILRILEDDHLTQFEIDLPEPLHLDNYSVEDRSQRLRALLKDCHFYMTDCYVTCHCGTQAAADEVVDLVRSLGGHATRLLHHDGLSVEIDNISPSYLLNEGEVMREDLRSNLESSRRIQLIRVVPRGKEETQCIAIDHPEHLYVVDDYVVTHNTVTALVSASRLKNRLAISVLAGYVEKWNNDLLDIYEMDPKDIYRIEGKGSLVDYCQMVLENQATPEKLPKATVISLNTIGKWFKLYMEDPYNPALDMYGMKPWELMEKARIGTNIFDENHQHLHAVYRMFCFLHIPKTISLSATLTSEDQTELRIQRMMYPRHKRFEKIKMKKYITVFACQYQIKDYASSRVRTTEFGSNNYSHVAFEKSILGHKSIRTQYLSMITRMVKGGFVDTMQKGDKCAVFVSSHAMAKEVKAALKKEFGDLDIRTYLEEDPIENLMDSDIRVTTVLSGGTAHDIKGLTVSIQTINLNSIRSNLQVLGRLREIAGRDIRFYYLYCSSIPKHVEYHLNKVEMFKEWSQEQRAVMLDPLIPTSNSHNRPVFSRY